jgi:hypothetical protein
MARAALGLVVLALLAPQEPDAETVQKVRALIVQLRDRNPAVKRKAEDDLVSLGAAALPVLRIEESQLNPGELKGKLGVIIRRIERLHSKSIASGNTLLVTLNASDRPIVEVFEELEKRTGVAIERKGVPPEAATTLDAKGISLWEAVDQVCAANGKLSWEVTKKGITIRRETYAKPFMATSSGYALIVRPFLRYPPGPGTGDRDYFRSDIIVVGPPSARAFSRHVTFESLVDEKGTDLLKTPSGLSAARPSIGEYRLLDEPDPTRPLLEPVTDNLDGAPAKGANRIKTCKGTATLQAVLDVERRLDLKGQFLKKGARDEGFGIILEVETLDTTGGKARLDLAITDTRIGARKDQKIFYQTTRGKILLRDAAGKEIPSEVTGITRGAPASGAGDAASRETTKFRVQASLKDGAVLAGLEIWEATYFEDIKIPFDFTSVPLKKAK